MAETLPQQLYTEEEVAKILHISSRTLQAWRLKGFGPPFVKMGSKSIRYKSCDLVAYIEDHTKTSTSDSGSHDQKKQAA
jgi:predicted DNA-binding transcriptional regulator AlpA